MNPKRGNAPKIIWSRFAKECIREISLYYSKVAGHSISGRIRSRIFYETRRLIKHPESGPIEPLLKEQEYVFRYCLAGNYKIIYTIVEEGILITDIFDTRQNPIKMNKHHRKQ